MGRLPLLRRATRYTGAQKQTPLKEILQLMKKQNYKFPASIEYESTRQEALTADRVKKCVRFHRNALA
jgi:hypothetical protein